MGESYLYSRADRNRRAHTRFGRFSRSQLCVRALPRRGVGQRFQYALADVFRLPDSRREVL